MTFGPEVLLERLDALETIAGKPDRYVIALSGGLDSTVLAHALAVTRDRHGKSLLAIHVDHQLQPGSAQWTVYCRELADRLGIEFVAERVAVDPTGGGLEAAAREARYAVLGRHIRSGDWLLSAHHRDDQAETLLLNLMRGSGPAGLAGIGVMSAFAGGWLARPLIDVSRAALEAYAAAQELRWIDDPSNDDLRFDRNYLRHDVLPAMEQRWPGVVERLARSAELASETAGMLDELAAIDLQRVGGRAARIEIEGLLELPEARQRNLLRYAIRRAGLPVPGAAPLATVIDSVLRAREDAQPLVAWPGAEVRRYRGTLYLLPPLDDVTGPPDGRALGTVGRGLSLRTRRGGEEIRPAAGAPTKKLKKLLQDEGVVPWMRDRLPLVFAGEALVAVADIWLAADAVSEPGTAVIWDDRPELY